MLKNIFPLKLYLTILQLEGYSPIRFLKWISKNYFKRTLPLKRKLVFTSKLQKIILISFMIVFFVSLISLIATKNLLITVLIIFLLVTQPFIILTIAVLLIKPYEIINRILTIDNTRKKILSLKHLEIIGITGSFGKSSTKEILYQIISPYYPTLKTPESFNTVFGVAKVVDLELDENYKYFICEMAAYNKGEIKTLCYMCPPKYGILTGITTQHFERFGSLENTIKAKFELVDGVSDIQNMIFNLDDQNILDELKRRNITSFGGYSIHNSDHKLSAKNISFTKDGSVFDLLIGEKSYAVKTRLFGISNIKNILAASGVALKIGVTIPQLITQINKLKPVESRLVLINDGKTTIVNNTYSSNPKGFEQILETAQKIKGKKVLITPGLVELGRIEIETHIKLGKDAKGIFDKVILVGKNNRTKSLANGLKDNYEFIEDTREAYFQTLENLKNKYEWIFLENDVTQNY